MDSARTGADGRYVFPITRAAPEMPCTSFLRRTMASRICRSRSPRRSPRGRGGDHGVRHDLAHVPLRVRGRHLVVSAPGANGSRSVVEVFELSNDTSVTVVSPGTGDRSADVVLVLPPGAQGVQVGQGDDQADAVTVRDNRIAVFAPFAPGLKQMSFSYSLPPASFPLARRCQAARSSSRCCSRKPVREPLACHSARKRRSPIEGRIFRRFIAAGCPGRTALRIRVPVIFSEQPHACTSPSSSRCSAL